MSYQNSRPARGGNKSRYVARPTNSRFSSGRNRPGRGGKSGASINSARYINKAVEVADEVHYAPTHTFKDFALAPAVQTNIERKGFTHPSAIQDQAINPILERRDLIGLANTGTGKTAAFLLPIITRISTLNTKPSVLIISPTRELAQQIEQEFRDFSRGLNLYSTLVVGGMPAHRQIRDLGRRPHIIIATPGRLNDLMNQGHVNLKYIDTLVLDEADRMLDMGFMPDIKRIVHEIPRDRQTLFFSATMTPDIERVVSEFLRDPVEVSVRTSETSDHVEQDVIRARDKNHKLELLIEMLSKEHYSKVLIFSKTKFGAQRLSDSLERAGIPSAAIHGNKSQSQRARVLREFKDETVRTMVATDVAARGLDIPNVSHVINFDQPATYEDYIHRIGRTGRGGARGHAHTFIEGGGY